MTTRAAPISEPGARSARPARRRSGLSYLGVVVSSYLLSPGFSLWIFSPILLLGIGGAWLLIKTRRYREFLVPLILLFSIVIGYAAMFGVARLWAAHAG